MRLNKLRAERRVQLKWKLHQLQCFFTAILMCVLKRVGLPEQLLPVRSELRIEERTVSTVRAKYERRLLPAKLGDNVHNL